MSDYIKATNFATKDTLSTGNPNKIIKGTEIDTEFNSIASAVASKADINSPSFTGTPVAPTASAGTNTTQVATTAHVFAERTNTATLANKTLTSPTINTPTISGGSISGITDLAVADGGTGASTLAANNVLLGNGTSALQTVAPSTSGNVLTSNGTTWTSAALPTGGVTSLNGQSGAITNTNIDTIGSYIAAVHAVTATTSGSTIGQNSTVAGSALRYAWACDDRLAFPSTNVSYTPFSSGSTVAYNQGGTALSGTWRCVGRGAGLNHTLNYCSSTVEVTWYSGMFVRVS